MQKVKFISVNGSTAKIKELGSGEINENHSKYLMQKN